MKVALLSHMFPNRVDPLLGVFVYERAKALSKLVDLDIIAPVSYVPFLKPKTIHENETFNGLEIRHPAFLAFPRALWHMKWIPYYLSLKKLWESKRPDIDILHVEWIYPDAFAAIKFAQKYNFKTVAIVHGNEAIGYFDEKHHRIKYIETFKGLDRIIVVSEDLRHKLINEYDVLDEKLTVIHNGVDLEKFPISSRDDAREKLGLPPERVIGVCVARLSQEKNLDVLIKAVAALNSKMPEIYIIGDGPLRSKLETLLIEQNVADRIKLLGAMPHNEIHWWLNAADFFCLPSEREGCPVVIHEALACGLPVISTTVGAIPELINNDEYGLLCRPSDSQALASMLRQVVETRWNRESITSYGRQFTWDMVAEQTAQVYKRVF